MTSSKMGRPKLDDKDKRIPCSIYFKQEKLDKLDSLNVGGFSKTVHWIIDKHFSKETHQDKMVETVLHFVRNSESHLELLGALELCKKLLIDSMGKEDDNS